jgi:ABC-2 type transport system permease protein
METYLFRSTLAEFLRPRRTMAWVIAAIAIALMGRVLISLNKDLSAQDAYLSLSGIVIYKLLALVSAIMATAVISQEVEQKTIVYLLTRPIPRPKILLARGLAAILSVAVITLFAGVLLAVATVGGFPDYVLRDLLALSVGAFAYTSLFLMVSLLVSRAMIPCLLFAFGWESAVPSMSGQIYLLTIQSYLASIAQAPADDGKRNAMEFLAGLLGKAHVSSGTAWAAMAALTVVCLAFSAAWFTRNEYVPREDGE